MKIAYNSIDGLVVQEMNTAPTYEHIVITNEIQTVINGMVKPSLLNGEIVETATPDEIAEANKVFVPSPISKMRFFLALLNLGITRAMVYELVNAIPDETLRETVLIKLDYSQEFDRNDPHLIMMASNFGMTSEQLDEIFING